MSMPERLLDCMTIECERLEVSLQRLAAAYVGENLHPCCHVAYRFHAIMPDGRHYYPTREAALAAVLSLADGSVGDSTADSDSAKQAARGVALGGSVEPTPKPI